MNLTKKSQAKFVAFFLAGILIFSLGILLHPTSRSLFPQYRNNLFKKLIPAISSPDNDVTLAQEFWEFREFYSRGEITLSKHSEIKVPQEITSLITLPDTFTPQLQFKSNKIISFEGILPNKDTILIPLEDLTTKKWKGWELRADSSQYRVLVNENDQKALIITTFELEVAGKANGYLHFDLRDDEFVEQHKDDIWLTINLIDLT